MIKQLSNSLISQIAAGEVVERPLSVVRELVDNAVDAGATLIEVELEEGGQALIRVQDNGKGIDPSEIKLAVARHATSKIASLDDLENVMTKGFRGEALASIAAVSKLSIKTRRSESGIVYDVVNDKVSSVSMGKGTSLEVKGLYYNTPARKKFLKTSNFETRKIKEWLIRYSLGHPEICFKLISDQKEILNYPASNLLGRAKNVFSAAGVEVDYTDGEIRVLGYILNPDLTHTDASQLTVLVNNRLISDRSIIQAVRLGFDSTLKPKEFPVGVINILITPNLVDVNVHPQKSEVRFQSADLVFRATRLAVLSAFSKKMEAPLTSHRQSSIFTPTFNNSTYKHEVLLSQPGYNAEGYFSNVRYMGQLLGGFLLCEKDEKFLIVDMHAAHERINFNKIRKSLLEKNINSQNLLIPQSVPLTASQFENLKEKIELLKTYGFEIDLLPASAVVRAVPAILANGTVTEMIKELSTIDFPEGTEEVFKTKIDEISARLACHASLRGGDSISVHEAYGLFHQMDSAEFALSCPHGRPVFKEFTRPEVEKWFGRDH